MIANPNNAIDLAYGFSSATLSAFLVSNWTTNYAKIAVGFDLQDGVLVQAQSLDTAQYVFRGSAFPLPPTETNASNQFVSFQSAPNSIVVNFAFYGASFQDNTNPDAPVFYKFFGFRGTPPKDATVVDLTSSPALIVSVPAHLNVANVSLASVPPTYTDNLNHLCPKGLPSDLAVMGVIALLDPPEVSVTAPSMSAYPSGQTLVAGVVGAWVALQPALLQLAMVYIATSAQAPFVAAVNATILPQGVVAGTSTTVPPSLLIACSVDTPLPENLAAVVADSGQLFSINQLTSTVGQPYTWSGAEPTACVALSPTFVADAIFDEVTGSTVFQSLITTQLLVGSWGESDHDENWVVEANWQVQTGGNPNASASFPTEAANPSLAGGNIVTWQGPPATSVGDGHFSRATLVSNADVLIGWQVANETSVSLGLYFTVFFKGTEVVYWLGETDTFYNMSEMEFFSANCTLSLATSPPPFPAIVFEPPTWTNVWPNPGPPADAETVRSMIEAIQDIQSFAQTLAIPLTLSQTGTLFVVGDLGCSLSPPMVDTQYSVNCVLTPSNQAPAPRT